MKKIISLILALSLLFCLCACDEQTTYEPQKSTEEESRVMMRVRYGSSSFDVRYELYRAFYLTARTDYPDGTLSAEDSAELEERVLGQIYHLHAVLAMCESLGYDVYGTDFEEKISDFVTVSVEGGYIDSTQIEGYGTYENYLASLKELNMNYAVQVLIFRYGIAKTRIEEHYASESGLYADITREQVLSFYEDADTGRYLTLYLSADSFSEERAHEIADQLSLLDGEDAVFAKMINYSALSIEALRGGQIITPYNLDALTYTELTEAAISLSEGEVSRPVPLVNSQNNGYMILYKAPKSEEHFDEYFDSITEEYVNHNSGVLLDEILQAMKENTTFYAIYETLDRESITMN